VAPSVINEYDYVFAQNGLEAFKAGEKIGETVRRANQLPQSSVGCSWLVLRCVRQSIKQHFPEDQLKELINFCLHYFADLDIPVKR
jgi:phosphomannomutase